MRITSIIVTIAAAFALMFSSFAAVQSADAKKTAKKPKVRHVVCLKFKAGTTQDQIAKIQAAFADLPKKITNIKKFEWGTNNSPEKMNKGFTHCFVLTFRSEKDRDEYLVHPAHKAFAAVLGPVLDEVFVIDYLAKD